MAQVGVDNYADYLDYLELYTEEFTALFNTILINVTGFFRDTEAWDYICTEILPNTIVAKKTTCNNTCMERRLRIRRRGLYVGHDSG